MSKVKGVLGVFGGALLGLAYGTLVIPIFDTLLSKVRLFPAYGGEPDFAFRLALYLLGVIPVLVVLGAWIGFQVATRVAAAPYCFLGGLVGTSIFAGTLNFLDGIAEPLSAGFANIGYAVSVIAHLILVVGGVIFGMRIYEKSASQ